MKCSKCGAELEAGASFCTICGTPAAAQPPKGDDTKTVLINQDNTGQPQGFPKPAQPDFQQQANTGSGAPNTNPQGGPTGYGQAPQGQGMTGFGQAPQGQGMNGFRQAPQGQGMNGFGQAPQGQGMNGFGQAPQGQGMNGFGQAPQGQGMNGYGQRPPQGMNGYGQPMYNQAPRPPKPPRKPLSKKAKIGIISGLAAVVVLVVFFVVILPIILRADLKGSYIYTDSWDDEYKFIFDGNTYLLYDYDDELAGAGTFTINKNNKVTLTSLDGDTNKGTFDPDENTIKIDGDTFESDDKKEKIDFTLTDNYIDTLESNVETATKAIIADEDLYDDLYWNGAYLSYNDLMSPYDDDFTEALAEKLNYSSDKVLQTLMEEGYLEIDIYMYSDGTIDVTVYTSDYYY